jgi:hypothetical protein
VKAKVGAGSRSADRQGTGTVNGRSIFCKPSVQLLNGICRALHIPEEEQEMKALQQILADAGQQKVGAGYLAG